MRRFLRRPAAYVVAAGIAVAAYGCTEQLEGGKACPILCPDQTVDLRETTVDAIVLDTTLSGYPSIGQEPLLLLTNHGDTIETRVIVRYDTLPTTFRAPNSPADSEITRVDSARLEIRLQYPSRYPDKAVTVEAYDVDTTDADGADTTAASMLPLFRQDRFLGSLTFKPADLLSATSAATDSIARIPIDSSYLLAKIQAHARLRVGLLLRGSDSAEIVLQGISQLRPTALTFGVSIDKAVPRSSALPYSATPAETFVRSDLADFVIVAHRLPPDTPVEVLTAGGVPGRRSYLRFDLPSRIVDSTSVVRATLLLTRYPNRLAVHPADSVRLFPHPLSASPLITDLARAATLLGSLTTFRIDTLIRTAPKDVGPFSIELAGLIQAWRTTKPEQLTRAIVLRLSSEGVDPDELYFYSTEAAAALRPRLRIVYVPSIGFGLP